MKNFNWKNFVQTVKDKLHALWEKWKALSKKIKALILTVLIVILVLALGLTIWLNSRDDGLRTIFPGMSTGEAVEVYNTLLEMGVPAQIDSTQQVTVPAAQWDALVFELNSRGYPKTTLSYDTFSSASGFTATEFEKRVALVQQAQDRAQQTLMRQDGIVDAVVTFWVPETSNYIWDQNNQQSSTANVSIRMASGKELTAERVSAIKHLVATTVPKLEPEDVVVVDAATGIEMLDNEELSSTEHGQRILELESLYAKRLEDKARQLLTPRYGAEGVTAVATVQLDYDKMVTETKEYQPLDNGDGGGVRRHYEESNMTSGNSSVGGIVGEENNDDVPQYPYDDNSGYVGSSSSSRLIDYDNSYILTQIERGQAIRSASIAVIVNDNEFTEEKEDTLTELISKAVNLTEDNVYVTNLTVGDATAPAASNTWFGLTQFQLIIVGVILFLILLLIILIVVLIRRRKKKKQQAAELAAAQAAEQQRLDVENAIAERKKKLQDEALANARPEENAIAEEIRQFADENPEITAELIRSMMKEDG